MSPVARQIVAVCVLALVVAVRVAQPGPVLGGDGGPEDFPRDVVVTRTQAPNVYADRPEVRVLQLLDTMNAMWRQAFADAGATYTPPRVRTAVGRAAEGCGSADGQGWAGLYCFGDRTIVIDLGDHLVGRAAVGDREADVLLGYVLAHEVGHHVQNLRGTQRLAADTLRTELQAQCLAGVWGRSAGHAPRPAWSYGVDADHGTAGQQAHWLGRGYAEGRPADCDGVWADGAVGPR